MRWRVQFYGLLALLFLGGLGLAAYKVFELKMPFLPGKKAVQWVVEAKVTFFAREGREVIASLALPDAQAELPGYREEAASLHYGFRIDEEEGGGRRGVWTARSKEGPQTLYYRVRTRAGAAAVRHREPMDARATPPIFNEAESIAARGVVDAARAMSADETSFSLELMRRLPIEPTEPEVALLFRRYPRLDRREAQAALAIDLFNMAGIPATRAQGVWLDESTAAQEPVSLVEYFDGSSWRVMLPSDPGRPFPDDLFVWNRQGRPLLDVEGGGEGSAVTFSTAREVVPREQLTREGVSTVLFTTMQSLPVSERAVFRYLIMVPVGALVVVLLRNIVGVPTLGTFMPVLIALSFSEIANLPAALLLFAMIIAVGLYFRFLLSRLNLLLVPRVAACVVIVTLLMVATSVASHHLGYNVGMRITLFPMIILAWTIERMSLLWDEEGGGSALRQVSGSLVVAIVAYLAMGLPLVRYWCFHFPELLLVVLGFIILLGRYTGYRLSELVRFRHFREVEP